MVSWINLHESSVKLVSVELERDVRVPGYCSNFICMAYQDCNYWVKFFQSPRLSCTAIKKFLGLLLLKGRDIMSPKFFVRACWRLLIIAKFHSKCQFDLFFLIHHLPGPTAEKGIWVFSNFCKVCISCNWAVETICGLDLAQPVCFTAEWAAFFLIDLRKIISKARFEPS